MKSLQEILIQTTGDLKAGNLSRVRRIIREQQLQEQDIQLLWDKFENIRYDIIRYQKLSENLKEKAFQTSDRHCFSELLSRHEISKEFLIKTKFDMNIRMYYILWNKKTREMYDAFGLKQLDLNSKSSYEQSLTSVLYSICALGKIEFKEVLDQISTMAVGVQIFESLFDVLSKRIEFDDEMFDLFNDVVFNSDRNIGYFHNNCIDNIVKRKNGCSEYKKAKVLLSK